MRMTTPIADFIRRYAAGDPARLHVPGHKGRGPLGIEAWDITEICGADSLYEAAGIIAESERNASELFGTAATLYSTEGSSHCIRAMMKLCLERFSGPGRPLVLAARNAHKAFLYAAALLDLDVEWLYPEEPGSLCACPIAPERLEEALKGCGTKPICAYFTSPDYLGGQQDLRALSAVCRRYGVPMAVDNAHGAYLRFLPGDAHPMELGADLCCDSAHKTLPVLTGGAYLHVSKNTWPGCAENAKAALSLFGSTSPSYLILASMDEANARLAERGREDYARTAARVADLKDLLRARGFAVSETEPLKLTLRTDGRAMARRLREGGVECEYADEGHLVMMFSPGNREEDPDRLVGALGEPLPYAPGEERGAAAAPRRMTIREAVLAPCEWVEARRSVGRVCASPAVSCPPAVPIAVSGEEITPEAAELFVRYGTERVQVVRREHT